MKKNKIISFTYIISLCMIVGILIYLGIVDNTQVMSLRNNAGYESVKNYSLEDISDKYAPAGVHNVYSWTMPEIGLGDNCLAFYLVHQYVQVYLDGELTYSMMPDDELCFGKTPGSSWVVIPLCPKDSGKEIKVVITPVYKSFSDRKVDLLIGSELSIYSGRLKKDLPQIIIGSIAFLVGIVFVMMSITTMINKKKDNSLAALGIFSIMLGLWRLTDTRFSPFVMPEKTMFLFYISLAMLMLGCVPFLKSVKYRFNKKFYSLFDFSCLISSVICIVQIILQITGIKDLRETLFMNHVMIIFCVLLSVGAMVHDWIKFGWHRMSGLEKSVFMLCVAGVACDVIAFYVKGNSSGLLFTLTALLIYIVFSGVITIYGFIEQEKRIKQQEEKLASSRISVMLSQIQPHFLYNSLNTIYHLCDKNPTMAKKTISDFSDYLRGNLDSLRRNTPIEFEKELEHVKIYLSLEKMRFDDELNIVYDIETTSFLIPALTVQPMVENAVKHGLNKSEHGGTVIISTKEYQDRYEVVVSDDGVGFDLEETKNDGRSHIGIENVRERLWEMSHATLDINSEKGKGTKVVIRIPKED